MSKEKILFAWSGGKDSALALHEIRRAGAFEVAALLTTVTEGYERISIHGVRRALLWEQARSLDLPLCEVVLPQQVSNEDYERRMEAALRPYHEQGIARVAHGDLFLEDVRRYRERQLGRLDMEGLFPLWGEPTGALARRFVAEGFGAYLVCVDTRVLDASFAGRLFDETLLGELPSGVDPCGENGEFHSFVFDGPVFRRPVSCSPGERVTREGFCYCDLLPSETEDPIP